MSETTTADLPEIDPGGSSESQTKEDRRIRSRLIAVSALFFVTGAVGLSLQVLWIKMLVNVFGATVYAVSTVISSFFAGLALGSYIFGKLGQRIRNPLFAYAALEFFVGVFALGSLFLYTNITPIWRAIYGLVGQNLHVHSFVRFLACFLFLLLPTTLMGGTLPILSKYFVRDFNKVGWNIGLAYSVNTFGALTGCFLVGFVLIEAIGIQSTLLASAGCSIIVALIAFIMSRGEKDIIVQEAPIAAKDQNGSNVEEGILTLRIIRLVVIVFAISGFASLSYELLWTRLLVYFIGVQTHAFTIMLITFLLGIALGSIFFARFMNLVKDKVFLFGILEVLTGLFSLVGLFMLGPVNRAVNNLQATGFAESWWEVAGIKFLVSALAMIFPTFLIGGTFPVVSKIVVDRVSHVSRRVGDIYALNTVGGIGGSLIAGFLFLPIIGIKRSFLLIVALNIILGLAHHRQSGGPWQVAG